MTRGKYGINWLPGQAKKAPHEVNCSKGGKHVPQTLEKKDKNNKHVKYKACTKCHEIL